MNTFFSVLLIGISLSMDAFSLALIYGTYGINKKNEILLALIVGLFHFFMPLSGYLVGSFVSIILSSSMNYFVSIIFFIIAIEMIISSFSNKDIKILNNLLSYILFGLSVSIDSFTTGIGFDYICSNYYFVSFIFMLCSGGLTYIGLVIGNRINLKFGNISCLIGSVILFMFAIYYLIS